MTYFNFNYITDPPNDETVDPETQLNANWRELDEKLVPFTEVPSVFSETPPVGTQAFYAGSNPAVSKNRIGVFNGTDWYASLNHASIWGPWQSIALKSPIVNRSSYPVVGRVDPVGRRVQISGAVQIGPSASDWPTNTDVEITSDADETSGISADLAPYPGGEHYQQLATSQIVIAGGFASAVARVAYVAGPPERVAIYIRFQGDSGGGNFVTLDGLMWWF